MPACNVFDRSVKYDETLIVICASFLYFGDFCCCFLLVSFVLGNYHYLTGAPQRFVGVWDAGRVLLGAGQASCGRGRPPNTVARLLVPKGVEGKGEEGLHKVFVSTYHSVAACDTEEASNPRRDQSGDLQSAGSTLECATGNPGGGADPDSCAAAAGRGKGARVKVEEGARGTQGKQHNVAYCIASHRNATQRNATQLIGCR